jgi:hypothetical protein
MFRTWMTARRFFRRNLPEIVSAAFAVFIIGSGVFVYARLPASTSVGDKALVVQCDFLALGLLSVFALLWEMRQSAAWKRVLSYHEYFSDLPGQDRVNAMYACLARLQLGIPSSGEPLSLDGAKAILADVGVACADGSRSPTGRKLVNDFLNDYEEFCGAVNAGVVSESYARELEGSRTINAYFGFKEVIELIRDEEAKGRQSSSERRTGAVAAAELQPFRTKPYHELRKVAVAWKRRRESEYLKALKRKDMTRQREEHEDELDGVPPET